MSGIASSPEDCPLSERHTPCPDGYLPWHEWATRKAKTHKQIRCNGCGLLAIWVPTTRRYGALAGAKAAG